MNPPKTKGIVTFYSQDNSYDGNNYVSYGIDDFGILCPKKLLTGTIISCKDYGLMELYKSKKILNEEISKSEVKKLSKEGIEGAVLMQIY